VPNILVKRSAESMLCDIDCSAILGTSETITGTPTITHDANGGAALTFGPATVNGSTVTYPDRRQVPAGKVVQCLIGGGSIPAGSFSAEYVIRARFATTNPGELREATVKLLVIDAP
jgi:hypothetical protein